MTGKENIVVIIPVYKEELSDGEKISFMQGCRILGDYDIILVAPLSLDLNNYFSIAGNTPLKIERFPSEYFKGIKGYNRLLLGSEFYKRFLSYEYMLIYQLDAFVFNNSLIDWCKKDFDYIGAPFMDPDWIKKLEIKLHFPVGRWINRVGNGGLSLRRVSKFYRGARLLFPLAYLWKYNEDFFWTSVAARILPSFKIPDFSTALQFAFEERPSAAFRMNNSNLPFGVHAWEKYEPEFWKDYIESFGYQIKD
ncbi:DUF5672 family protein [Sporocytophaga myxococcoides]|uniref:DUF5672 family protein n=1 Tax=Sporocytophaga myxococcoides TaxID=153721 RepID=UPI0009DD7DB2|nr:DUF5672 family protein [Sporocytophaga myxococcoides]